MSHDCHTREFFFTKFEVDQLNRSLFIMFSRLTHYVTVLL